MKIKIKNFIEVLAFDKPKPRYDINNCTYSRYVSDSSYGHSGYTGTFFWVDPEHKLIYVFYQIGYMTLEITEKFELNIRTNIHDLIL